MVIVQTAHRDAFPVSLDLPSDIAILAAVVRLDRETAVSPQLALGTKTVRGLQQGYQQGGSNRTDRRKAAAFSRHHVCDSLAAGRVAPPAAPVAVDPVVDTAVPLADELQVAGSSPTTPRDAARHRPWFRCREWPSC